MLHILKRTVGLYVLNATKVNRINKGAILYMNKILYDAFYDPEQGMQSSTKLYRKLKNKGITLKQVNQFIENQEAHQLNRQPVRVKHYFPITSTYENEIMQIDLADMSDIATTNDNYKWLLCGIDTFTRKAYVIPLKNKTAVSVTTGMKHIRQCSTTYCKL